VGEYKLNILIVDDEIEIVELVELYLLNENYTIFKCYSGLEAMKTIENKGAQIDLALLDIMLPDMDGFHICKIIRDKYTFPIIMLTAKVQDIDKINGLMIGADDYITKPFNPLVVVAKVRAQLRRYTKYNVKSESEIEPEMDAENVFEYDGLIINNKSHQCMLYDKEVLLTPIEFKILWVLCENGGTVVSAEALFENVWGEKYLDCNNTVMVHIRRLREKLQEPSRNPKFVKTVWGVGYKIEAEKK